MLLDNETSVNYLKQIMKTNKARGMVAEIAFGSYLSELDKRAALKILPGAWILSPNVDNPYHYRYATFVLPELFSSEEELKKAVENFESDRGKQALATFLTMSGVGVIVAAGLSSQITIQPDDIRWKCYTYNKEKLVASNDNLPFSNWPGNRGRAIVNTENWSADVLSRFDTATQEQITELTLRQAFYYGFLKKRLKKPIADPYDVDAFIVSYQGAVMPVEIKEKSSTPKGDFGIDAGRILMMLRMGIAVDSNALYMVREIDNSPERKFVQWRYITLSDMIMGCSWNLQAGGAGMGGGSTQTVMMQGSLFNTFTFENLSEEWLSNNSKLQSSVKKQAQTFANDLAKYL